MIQEKTKIFGRLKLNGKCPITENGTVIGETKKLRPDACIHRIAVESKKGIITKISFSR